MYLYCFRVVNIAFGSNYFQILNKAIKYVGAVPLPARAEKINIKTGDPVLFDRNKYLYIPERFFALPSGGKQYPGSVSQRKN